MSELLASGRAAGSRCCFGAAGLLRRLVALVSRGLVGVLGGRSRGRRGCRSSRRVLSQHRTGKSDTCHKQGSDRKFTHHDHEPRDFGRHGPGRNPAIAGGVTALTMHPPRHTETERRLENVDAAGSHLNKHPNPLTSHWHAYRFRQDSNATAQEWWPAPVLPWPHPRRSFPRPCIGTAPAQAARPGRRQPDARSGG